MTTARDGSPIEVYELLPELGEGELVAAAVGAGGTILELGCGTGRMTRQLVARGYRVTAVDESEEMLARVEDAEKVHARIEGLDVGRRFDAVLRASNLLSTEPVRRRAFLDTCARHAELLVVETLPLGWEPREGARTLGEVTARTRVDAIADGVVRGAAIYEVRGRSWTHEFSMRVFADEEELAAALGVAGFRFERWLDRARGWFVARCV
ncbi:MAG: class I SAM-dependent methyltransferase [Gaiellaceae bacterium]